MLISRVRRDKTGREWNLDSKYKMTKSQKSENKTIVTEKSNITIIKSMSLLSLWVLLSSSHDSHAIDQA